MTWHKCDVRMQCSPRLRSIGVAEGTKAQQIATLAWLAILAVNAEHDCDGKVSAMYADVGYLVTFCPTVSAIELRRAFGHLSQAGLIEFGASGELQIIGWDETWRATKTSTARVRLHRQLKAERARQQEAADKRRDGVQ